MLTNKGDKLLSASYKIADSHSDGIPLLYYPRLKLAYSSTFGALIVSYLETCFSSPQPEPGSRHGLPVDVDYGRMAQDLGTDRRTLGLALIAVGTWYETELKRLTAAKQGREFVCRSHSRHPARKLYSIVGPKSFLSSKTLAIRRNWPLLRETLATCGFTTGVTQPVQPKILPNADALAPAHASTLSNLSEIILKGVELAQDRRSTRYERQRKAVAEREPAKDLPELDEIAKRIAGKSMTSGK